MAISSYGYDPYFLQAFNSPNYNAQVAQNQQNSSQLQQQSQTSNTTNTNSSITTDGSVNFKGAADSIKEEKSSNTAKWILGTLAAIGTIYVGYKCHGKASVKIGILKFGMVLNSIGIKV